MFRPSYQPRLLRTAKQSLCKYSTNAATEGLVYPDHKAQTTMTSQLPRIRHPHKHGPEEHHLCWNTLESPFKRPRTARNVSQTDWRESDYGIDLLGTWSVPSALQPLKVLIQCKAFARKIEPSQARELEGAFVGAPIGWREAGVLGLLVSQKSATKG